MQKKELLEKYKKSNENEFAKHVESKGSVIGFIITAIFTFAIALACLFFWQPITLHASLAVFFAQYAGFSFGQYLAGKRKIFLVTSIASCLVAIAELVNFIIMIQG